jgi:DNA-binding NarL/FixJ family response regulator
MSKGESAERLIGAIRRAAQGEILFDAEQLARARRWRENVSEKWASLTQRERQVLKLVAEGMDNKAIAKTLKITPKTAAFHVTHILGKLGVDTRQKAVAWIHAHLSDDLEK